MRTMDLEVIVGNVNFERSKASITLVAKLADEIVRNVPVALYEMPPGCTGVHVGPPAHLAPKALLSFDDLICNNSNLRYKTGVEHFLRNLVDVGHVLFEVAQQSVLPAAIGAGVSLRPRKMDLVIMPSGRAIVLEGLGTHQALKLAVVHPGQAEVNA